MRLIDELDDMLEALKDSGSLRAVEHFNAMIWELFHRDELSGFAWARLRGEIETHFGV